MLVAFLLLVQAAPPMNLEFITEDQAKKLNGQRVTVIAKIATPTYTWRGWTIAGVAESQNQLSKRRVQGTF